MKIECKKIAAPVDIMRRAGYAFQLRTDTEMSFIRPLARSGYPRFHVYLTGDASTTTLSIHLDQKRETYGRSTRHHGEYTDEGALHTEIERLKSVLDHKTLLA